MLCLRCTFAVGSLYLRFFLDVGSEHMMEAEGHYRENRVEPAPPMTGRDGLQYTHFERIRMKGITSISVGGMVLH